MKKYLFLFLIPSFVFAVWWNPFSWSKNQFGASTFFPYQGGTGTSTAPTYGQLLVGNDSRTYTLTATSSLGVGGTPGGSDTQVQFNDGGSFGGSSNLTWNNTNNLLTSPYASTTYLSSSVNVVTPLITSSTTAIQLTGSGVKIGVGTAPTLTDNAKIQVRANEVDTSSAGIDVQQNSDTDTDGAFYSISRARGVNTARTIVQANDLIGTIQFDGFMSEAAYFGTAADITVWVDGTPGASNDMPGRMVFATTRDGLAVATERMRINNAGHITVGSSGVDLAKLAVDGEANEIQFLLQGNSTQTTPIFTTEKSDGTDLFVIVNTGNVGIGTTTPGTLLSLGNTGNDTINISVTATSTFGQGIDLRSGCFAINGACVGVIPDSYLLNTGDVGTGVYDFGGATSFEIVNGAAPTVDATGEIAVDTTSDQLIYFGATAKKVISPLRDLGFAYASTSWTGTTTLRIGPSPSAITVSHAFCETDTGTVGVSLYDGTNRANYIPTASTTINKFTYSTNNTFTEGETIRVDAGTPASSPRYLSCRLIYTYNPD